MSHDPPADFTIHTHGSGRGLSFVLESLSLGEGFFVRPFNFTAGMANVEILLIGTLTDDIQQQMPAILRRGGLILLCEHQPPCSAADWAAWKSLAKTSGGELALIPWELHSFDYRQTFLALSSGQLGNPIWMRHSTRMLAVSDDAPPGEWTSPDHCLWPELVQLIELSHGSPGQPTSHSLEWQVLSVMKLDGATQRGINVVLRSETGILAELSRWTKCFTLENTGWTVEATAGGSSQGRRYHLEPDGELVDEPLSSEACDFSLIEWCRQFCGRDSQTFREFDATFEALRLLDAIRREPAE